MVDSCSASLVLSVAGVEKVGAVLVYLDTGLRLRLGIGIAAEVGPALDDEHSLVQLGGHPLGGGEAEKPGSDDDQVVPTCITINQCSPDIHMCKRSPSVLMWRNHPIVGQGVRGGT
jgi:hypothetical protein